MELAPKHSQRIKYEALRWLRIEQRCAFIATEVGPFCCDALGANEKKMVEVECKTSLSDLRADFKKPKHIAYGKDEREYGLSGWNKQWQPTHFYYAVTPELVEPCRALLNAHKVPKYGIIECGMQELEPGSVHTTFTVVKRADWLHKTPPGSHAKYTIALRMGSELLRFHAAWI